MTISIELASGSKEERSLKVRLLRVLDTHRGLERWRFTDKVVIDEKSVGSHSYPVLTIGARSLGTRTDSGLLSVYVHENMHWFVSRHPVLLRRALRDLRAKYPRVRVGAKEGGARNEKSTYLHLLVCTLEYDALREILGKQAAYRVLSSTNYYQWIYKTVLRDFAAIRGICSTHRLVPEMTRVLGPSRERCEAQG